MGLIFMVFYIFLIQISVTRLRSLPRATIYCSGKHLSCHLRLTTDYLKPKHVVRFYTTKI